MTDLRSLFEMLGFHSEDWFKDALCAQTDPDVFFPPPGYPAVEAKTVCAACPVRDMCLEYAVEHGERDGIWGGLNPRQRARLRSPRVCRMCGVSIAGSGQTVRFCSPGCAAEGRRVSKREYEHRRAS